MRGLLTTCCFPSALLLHPPSHWSYINKRSCVRNDFICGITFARSWPETQVICTIFQQHHVFMCWPVSWALSGVSSSLSLPSCCCCCCCFWSLRSLSCGWTVAVAVVAVGQRTPARVLILGPFDGISGHSLDSCNWPGAANQTTAPATL